MKKTCDTAGAMPTGNVTVVYTVNDKNTSVSTYGVVIVCADNTAGVSVAEDNLGTPDFMGRFVVIGSKLIKENIEKLVLKK